MSFRVKDKQLLKNYNKIWEKVEKLINIDFENKPVYGDDDKYIKTKIKTYEKSIITNFHNKKRPKEKASCKCLSIIMIGSVIKANKKYYPQTLLEECKYIQEKIKTENYINKDLEKSESDSDSNNNLLKIVHTRFYSLLCLDFFASQYFFGILLILASFRLAYYDIYFFHILSFSFYFLQISFYIYLLLALLIYIIFIIIFCSI